MGLLLDLGYGAASLLASPYLLFKAATDGRYRHRLGERLGGGAKRESYGRCLWLHCASVGEVNVVRPLVRELLRRIPDLKLHLSTVTRAGRETAEKAFPEATVRYWPLDFTFAVRRAIRRVRPSAVVLVELEVWPNFTSVAVRQGIPLVVINGRLSRRSDRRFRHMAWLWRRVFRRLTKVGAQSEDYADRFRGLGLGGGRVAVTGNLKYDAALSFDPAAAAVEMRQTLGLREDEPLLIAGSTHDPEERLLVEAYRALKADHPQLRLLIAPRHLERVGEVEKIIVEAGFKAARRTQGPASDDSVLLLDTVGELAKAYTLASAVFIGGTFCSRGGQNMLEPAALGKAVVSGPSLENFREISDELSSAGAMTILADPSALAGSLDGLLRDPARAREMGAKALKVVEAGRGAIRATCDLIEGVLPVARG